ncbi:MAG: universal stress protein [Chloroflexota bacterium]|nr:universal stress protein [Chloroflexota bacterium]
MCNVPSHDAVLSILIPWDGNIPIDALLALAGSIGGPEAHLLLLPVTAGHVDDGGMDHASSPNREALESTRPRLEWLERSDSTDPAMEVVATAARRDADLILMATTCHPGGAIDASCLAARLALDSPTPVMVVHLEGDLSTAVPAPISRLLIALDGSARAAQSLPLAASLAGRLGVAVALVMVIDPRRVLPPAYAYDSEASAEMIARLRGEAHGALSQAERQLANEGVTVTSELLYGPVIESIEAAVQPGDVLVLTTHGVGGATQSQLGSVAAQLVADNPGPLLIMRGSPLNSIVASGHGERGPYESFSRPTA